jgi:hypothetical protein
MVKCARGGVCRGRVTHPGSVRQLRGSAHIMYVPLEIVHVQWTSVHAEGFAVVESLIQNQYGNYVVQHILGMCR